MEKKIRVLPPGDQEHDLQPVRPDMIQTTGHSGCLKDVWKSVQNYTACIEFRCSIYKQTLSS